MAYENLISTKVPVTAPALLTAITEAATTGTAGVDFQAVLSARWEDGSFQEDIPGQTLLPGNLPVSGTVAAPEVLEKAQSVPLSAVQDFFSYARSLGYNPPDEILEGIDDVLPTASTTTTRGIPLTEDVFLTASADTIEGFSRPDSTDELNPSVAPDLPVLPSTDAQALVAMMLGTAMQPVYAAATGGVANPAVETPQSGPTAVEADPSILPSTDAQALVAMMPGTAMRPVYATATGGVADPAVETPQSGPTAVEADPSILPSTDAQALVAMMLGTAMQPVYAAATGGVANPAVETPQSGPTAVEADPSILPSTDAQALVAMMPGTAMRPVYATATGGVADPAVETPQSGPTAVEADPSILPSTDAQALVAMMLGTAMQPVYAAATGGVANPAVETPQSGPMMTASAPIATVSVAEADFAQVISTAEGQSRPAPMAAGLITGETANPVEKPVSMDQPESSFNQAIDAAMDARAGTPDHSVLAEAGNTRLTPIPLPERQAVASTPAQDWLVQSRVGDPVWSDELGGQITVMLDKTLQNAEIRLNPEHLGPLQVTIRMENDQLAIQFSSEHAVVREALEVASSRLRDMLTSQQLNPTEISVSPPEPRQDTGHAFGGFDRQSRSAYNDSAHEPSGSGRTVIGADDQETVTVTQVSTPSDRSISFYA